MTESKTRRPKVVRRRPAESTSAAGGIAGIAVALTAGDTTTLIVALLGFVPAAVTLLVENGGVRGVARLLWGSVPAPSRASS